MPGFSCATQDLSCGMRTLSCRMWDLVPWLGTEPGSPSLGMWSLSYSLGRLLDPLNKNFQ